MCEYLDLLDKVRERIKEKVALGEYKDSKEVMRDVKACSAIHDAADTIRALLVKKGDKDDV